MSQFKLSTKKQWKKARSIFSAYLRRKDISDHMRFEIKNCWHFANSMAKGHLWVLQQRGINCPFPDFVRETADRLRLSAGLKPIFGEFSPKIRPAGYYSQHERYTCKGIVDSGEHSLYSPIVRPEKRLTMQDVAMHYVLTGRM